MCEKCETADAQASEILDPHFDPSIELDLRRALSLGLLEYLFKQVYNLADEDPEVTIRLAMDCLARALSEKGVGMKVETKNITEPSDNWTDM